jgi:hypothetical protein
MPGYADWIYAGAPLVLVFSVLTWHGAHGVSQVLIGVMVLMIPMMFYIVYSERFDDYWIKREQSKPAEVFVMHHLWMTRH